MPAWCRSRLVARGPNADVFARDFMASYNRTKYDDSCSDMDGVFATSNLVQENYARLPAPLNAMAQLPGNRTLSCVFGAKSSQVSDRVVELQFSTKWRPVYEPDHLKTISAAYPLLSFTYDNAEFQMKHYDRWFMKRGVITKANASALEVVKREPEFKKLIDESNEASRSSPSGLALYGVLARDWI